MVEELHMKDNNSSKSLNYNNQVINKLELTSQEVMLLNSLEEFYNKKEHYNLLCSIINGTSFISRRTIEYFVTNYSDNHKIIYELEEKNKTIRFNVHASYKDQLKAHRKKYFDPFGRGDRIPFFSNNDCIITTIGQLNFYKWFFSKKVYNYCINNYKFIQDSLVNSKLVSKKKNKNLHKTRHIIKKSNIRYDYVSSQRNMSSGGDIVVSFDI